MPLYIPPGTVPAGSISASEVESPFTGHLLFTDNTYDIGASGATRPRTGYFGTGLRVGTPSAASAAVGVGADVFFVTQLGVERTAASGPGAGAQLYLIENDGAALASGDRLGGAFFGGSRSGSAVSLAAAVISFAAENWSDTAVGTRLSFQTVANTTTTRTEKFGVEQDGRVTFGDATSSGFSLKRSGATMQARLGDDSADADLKALHIVTSATDFLHKTTGTLADGAAANTGTLTNSPAAGNPTKWVAIDDNGTTRHIPAW